MAEIVSKKDVGLEPNIVVSGEQKGEFIIERHRELYVGNKVLSSLYGSNDGKNKPSTTILLGDYNLNLKGSLAGHS